MAMTFTLLAAGLALLLVGGTALVKGASSLASHFGVSPLVIGLTVVAFGTSSPELIVNLVGAFRGETSLAFGNVAGSNLANLGLVLGTAALISPVLIQGQIVRRELPLLLLGTTMLLVMTLDMPLLGAAPVITASDGLILLLFFSVFVYITVGDFMNQRQDALLLNVEHLEEVVPVPVDGGLVINWLFVVGGIAGLTFGGHLTISAGADLATAMGVDPVIVGIVIVAIGTSLPELVTSITAALRDESDLCLGNVVGSNIFNGLVVLPLSSLVRPLPVPPGGQLDIFVSILLCLVLIPLFVFGKARMDRKMGCVMLAAYALYVAYRTSALL